jgi:hypothetical protein
MFTIMVTGTWPSALLFKIPFQFFSLSHHSHQFTWLVGQMWVDSGFMCHFSQVFIALIEV